MTAPGPGDVERLVGIYDADGTLWGELSYVVGHLLGRTHCALCDVTHGSLRPKASWQRCQAQLGVPFAAIHRDERDDDLRDLTDGELPCVVAVTARGPEILVTADQLEACAGDPERLAAMIDDALADRPTA